ncbi:MAG: hypothetical protein KAH77_06495 [Thiomargarita sp.]|nr:hypothetical protein [Thiomargarita sp.]
MENIITKAYSVKYDAETTTVYFQGVMRLNGTEYVPIKQLLNDILEVDHPVIILNLQGLEVLNSSGISILGRFVFTVANKKTIHLIVQGAEKFVWQRKWVLNFKRLMPSLLLEWK